VTKKTCYDRMDGASRLRETYVGTRELRGSHVCLRRAQSSGTTAEYSRRMLKLVCFNYLVSFVQPNKRDKPNKPNNGLLRLAGFFSILLEGSQRLMTISRATLPLGPKGF